MKRWGELAFVSFFSVFAWAQPSSFYHTFEQQKQLLLSELATSLSDYLENEGSTYKGQWQGGERWSSWLCNGYGYYNLKVRGIAQRPSVLLLEDGQIYTHLIFTENEGGFRGYYRSGWTLCVPLGVMLYAQASSVSLRSTLRVFMQNNHVKIHLRVYDLAIHGLQLSLWDRESSWFENHISRLLAKAVRAVWSTSLGRWIEHKVASLLQTHWGRRSLSLSLTISE